MELNLYKTPYLNSYTYWHLISVKNDHGKIDQSISWWNVFPISQRKRTSIHWWAQTVLQNVFLWNWRLGNFQGKQVVRRDRVRRCPIRKWLKLQFIFQHGCHWELYWSNGLAGNWQAAAESMKILVDGSFWSPAVINYLYAIVLVRIIHRFSSCA